MSATGARPRQTSVPSGSSVPSLSVDVDSAVWVGIVCPLLGISAAWMAAGSAGLLGHALRHAFALLLLGASALIALSVPGGPRSWKRIGALSAAGAAGLWMLSNPLPAVNVFGVALVLGTLAWERGKQERGETRQAPFLAAAGSVLGLGLFKFAVHAFPGLWLAVDWVSKCMTNLVGHVVGRPLHGGLTFAGLDFLVLMGVLLGSWNMAGPVPRWGRMLRMAALVLGAHGLYLAAVAYAPLLLPLLPASRENAFGVTPRWDWAQGLRGFIPWNMPMVGGLLHLLVAALLFKRWPMAVRGVATEKSGLVGRVGWAGWLGRFAPRTRAGSWLAIGLLCVALPQLAMLNTRSLSLSGKKVVLYEKGFLNWLKPKHGEYGRLSVGMYGVLPEFLQSYGTTCVVSPDLSEADLAGAQLLVLIFPNKPWAPGQLERIWNFTRAGGSLLVLGEHTVEEKEGGNRFNDVLKPTALRVAFDSAYFEVGGWLESYDALSHPATAGLQDHRNEFGVVVGASVEARWPARPLLVGRFGWADRGDVTNDEKKGGSMMGNHRYDAGEKLGDLLLAAEQRFGRGRVIAFGDTSGFTNTILLGAHEFVTRLFGYLCNDVAMGWPRQVLAGLGLVLVGLGFLAWPRADVVTLGACSLAVSIVVANAWSHHQGDMMPDGRNVPRNRLAYLDASHFEHSSAESWRDNGLGGLHLTLMRNDYLVLGMEEFKRERLERAGLFISVAPSRPFSRQEILAVREFIEGGGTFICTVGWPESAPSRELLAELGFYVGGIGAATSGLPEPKPFGHFKAPYFNGGDYMAYVRFHAAWHVESTDPQAQPLAFGPRDPKAPDAPDPPVILMRRLGRGKVVVVADTYFATNQNLEREGGQPFEGLRENADFWRWFLGFLNDQPSWTPPKPTPVTPAGPAAPPAPAPAGPDAVPGEPKP